MMENGALKFSILENFLMRSSWITVFSSIAIQTAIAIPPTRVLSLDTDRCGNPTSVQRLPGHRITKDKIGDRVKMYRARYDHK